MKFTKLNKPGSVANVNITKYICDWHRVVSKPQKQVKDFLYPYWNSHVVLEEFRIPGSRLRIDLVNLTNKIAIEVSPRSSHSFNKFFHRSPLLFGAAVKRDIDKEEWIKQNGFKFVEIFEEDLEQLSQKWFEEKYGITI